MPENLSVNAWVPLALFCTVLAGPAVASACLEGERRAMPECASVELSNDDRNYSIANGCDFKMMAVITVTSAEEATIYLDPGETDFSSLREEIAVESVKCCTAEEPEYSCTAW